MAWFGLRSADLSVATNLILWSSLVVDGQDEYNEVVSLGEVRLIIGEWVPFGDNAVASMMDKLGCQDRVQGGFFSDVIDSFPSEERLETPSGLTGVRILEFDLLNFVNFEADIHFAEEEGIVQVENFGTHVRSDGFVLYGIKIEAIMDHGADNVSLDLMSRLLMDIQNDSTRIIDSLVSEYQRRFAMRFVRAASSAFVVECTRPSKLLSSKRIQCKFKHMDLIAGRVCTDKISSQTACWTWFSMATESHATNSTLFCPK